MALRHNHRRSRVRLAIEEEMRLSGRATGRALLPDEDIAFDHGNRNLHEPTPETPGRNQLRRAHRQSRKDVFETVHALSKEGLTCSDIARRTGYGRRSITKWLTFETAPDRRRGALQPTSPLYFEAFLTQSWKVATAMGGICSTISSSEDTRAAFLIGAPPGNMAPRRETGNG